MPFQASACVEGDPVLLRMLVGREFKEAEKWVNERIKLNPEEPTGYMDLATVYGTRTFMDTNKLNSAKGELRQNLETGFDQSFSPVVEYNQEYLDKTVRIYRTIINDWPGFKRVWVCLLNIYQVANQDKEMLMVVDEMVLAYGSNQEVLVNDLMLEAVPMIKNGQHERAVIYYQYLLEYFPDSLPLLNAYAYLQMSMGQLDKAIEYFQKVLQLNEQDQLALFNLGKSYLYRRDYTLATEVFEKLILIEPESISVSFQLAILSLLKEDKEAIQAWDRFLKDNVQKPEDNEWISIARQISEDLKSDFSVEKRFKLAESFSRIDLNEYSLPILNSLMNKDPGNPRYPFRVAGIYEREKMLEMAYNYAKTATLITEEGGNKYNNPVRSRSSYETGRIAYKLGRYKESLGYLENAVELNNKQTNIQYMLGLVNQKLENWQEAAYWLKQCVNKKNNLRFMKDCQFKLEKLESEKTTLINK